MARTTPLWLAEPTRFAALSRGRARLVLGLIVLLVAVCLTALLVPEPPALDAGSGGSRDQTDLMLYDSIVGGVRGGGNYYAVAADALRAGDYPLRPFFTFRLPALAVILASLPEWMPPALLILLATLTALAWALRLAETLPRVLPRIVAGMLLIGSLIAFFQPALVGFHEIWAGLLVALSLALRRPERWVAAAAIGLVAMLIRETAALYVLVMAIVALAEGHRREAIGWGVALAAFAAMLAVHAWAVASVTGPLDPASPGWTGLHGFGLFVKAVSLATALQMLPLWAAAPLVGLTLLGWAAWRDPLGLRMIVVLLGYALAIALFARLDTFYWGLMVAPVLLVGLVFVPDALGELLSRALDRRRVTVTRVAR